MDELHGELFLLEIVVGFDDDVQNVPGFEVSKDGVFGYFLFELLQGHAEHFRKGLIIKFLGV